MSSITKPSLELLFLGSDLKMDRPNEQTITKEFIIKHTITFKKQLLNELKSASNQVTLLIDKECVSIEDIIATDGDVKAILKDDEQVLFTGYISTNFSWTITQRGKQALEITIEDIGSRLLGKSFIKNGRHLFNCKADEAILQICNVANIVVSDKNYPLNHKITKLVDSSVTCKELLEKLVYELGYVYYFDELGHLRLFEINCSNFADLPILDKDDLYVVGGKAISLNKKIRSYKSARVSFKQLGTASNYLVYRNTTGQSETYPYCNFNLEGNHYFDGVEFYTLQQWIENQIDTFGNSPLIEACNASSESSIVGSNEIISISNITVDFVAQSGSISCNITKAGGPYLQIEAHNSSQLPYYITKMDAYADIIFVKDLNILRTADVIEGDESSDNLISEELEFVHSRALAQEHANRLCQYHRYANSQYTFYSKRDLDLGSIVKVIDNAFSNLNLNVLLVAKTYTDESAIIKYSAVGISQFDLNASVHSQSINNGQSDFMGQKGPAGEDALILQVISSFGTVFRMSEPFETTLRVQVLKGGNDITDSFSDSDFRWYRTSSDSHSDALWNSEQQSKGTKELVITQNDVAEKSTFFCELIKET
jgi:hypothetical protein